MLTFSPGAFAALREDEIRSLRPRIGAHWFERLNASGETAGKAGRAEVLDATEQLARDNPDLHAPELTMLADLMLIDHVARMRGGADGG